MQIRFLPTIRAYWAYPRASLFGMDSNTALVAVRAGPRHVLERARQRHAHRGVELLHDAAGEVPDDDTVTPRTDL
eukprot:scaffold2991_cov403-Prasinococcus_capsulatus_cf.AAC.13